MYSEPYRHNQLKERLLKLATWPTENSKLIRGCRDILKTVIICQLEKTVYLSQARIVQAAIIQSETEKTSRTVPGHIVINVFITNLN